MLKSFTNFGQNTFLRTGNFSRFHGNFRIGRIALFALLVVAEFAAFMLMTELPARAYVDPGSGLLALQAAGASLMGGLFYLRYKLRRVLSKSNPHSDGEATDTGREDLPILGNRQRTQTSGL